MTARSSVPLRRGLTSQALLPFAVDAACWISALVLAVVLNAGGRLDQAGWSGLIVLSGVAVLAAALSAWWFRLYRQRFGPGSFHEIKSLLGVVAVTILAVGVVNLIFSDAFSIPAFVVVVAGAFALVLLGAIRYSRRLRYETASHPAESAERTLIYGAGYLGSHLIRRMLTDRASPYDAVAVIDDDAAKRGLSLDGVPVVGPISDLEAIVAQTGATALIVSIARADTTLLRNTSDAGERLGLKVLVFPSLEEVLEGKSRLRDVREIAIEDLIGRHPVETDVESMAGYLEGHRILVTGAGGSIGAELCRQISKYRPEELVMLDRDETGLQSTQLLLEGNGLLSNKNLVLADIRDADALEDVFARYRPDVVFHAAALKHLPMLERFPEEAWKTNVLGTRNVLRAAAQHGVETFVNISTDKAANPKSVLGYSKQVAERLTSWTGLQTGKRYLSVRFGNVLGSRGSLVPVFASMIEAGGPLTVTHKDVTRYFMTIPEACHLVVQAGGIGAPGEVLILDMGEPVRILDIAQRMIAKSGRDIAIVFTGLRDGEKLHEELVGDGEQTIRPKHPKIAHARAVPLSPDELSDEAWNRMRGHVSH